MKSNIPTLVPETFYHIYNRGINGEQLFKEERNYSFFLKKYGQFLSNVLDTYAYCLMGNHFHFLIKTKSENEILEFYSQKDTQKEGIPQRDAFLKSASWHISNQFASLFKSYALTINKTYNRTGGLFEEPFRRIEVKSDAQFSQLIYYIHSNPVKHGFCKDFRDYPHSSYWSHLSLANSKLKRNEVLNWFGNKEKFIQFHSINNDLGDIKDYIIEFD